MSMMMCSRCHKRPAVVFMTGLNGSEKFEKGYCLACAKELGIPQVNNYLKQMGISDEDIENGFNMLFGGPNDEDENPDDTDIPDDEDFDDDDAVDAFKQGGAGIIPPFMEKFFSPNGETASEETRGSENENKEKKKKENKKRKFLDTFCTNLTARAKDASITIRS